jgi:tetratricopeptide (TPR) repeat protein
MKKAIFITVLSLFIASCAPSRHAIHVEMCHPSKSGIDLNGKIVAMVCAEDSSALRTQVIEGIAEGFAASLEQDYQTGEGSVAVCRIDTQLEDYTSKESLVDLVVETGSDLVFLLDIAMPQEETVGGTVVRVDLYCYDGMDKADNVKKYSGATVLSAPTTSSAALVNEAQKAGKRLSDSFLTQWKHEQYSIAYYDTAKWYESLVLAEQYDWKGAMEIWLELLSTKDMMKRASAEYNIAVACYMLGDFDLALEWLDRSDADNKLPTLSDGLRKRIEARQR